MKRTLSNPVFLVCLALAVANQILEKGFGVFVPIVHSYLDDLLCFPILFTICLSVYRFVHPTYKLGLIHIVPVLIVYSVYFEWYLPSQGSATGDIFDVIMYVLGTALFGYFINNSNGLSLPLTNNTAQ